MSEAGEVLFDGEFLRKLERLEVLARKQFRGHLRGEHTTRRRGRGVEFADYRQYQPGDDFRHIDWNLYSRLDRLFIRLFTADEDLSLYVLLDTSASMNFGSPRKFDYARRIAGALAYIGLSSLDRVSVLPYAGELMRGLSSLRVKQQAGAVFDYLTQLGCGGETDLPGVVSSLAPRARNPGLVIVVSDFLGAAEPYRALDQLRAMGHDVLSLQVLAEEEIDPPLDGSLLLIDAEDQTRLPVSVDARLRGLYIERLVEHLDRLEAYCRRHRLEYLRATTAVPFEELVLRYLRQGGLFG